MATQPLISFRSNTSPYAVISSLLYAQSAIGGNNLPIAGGEVSNIVYFRVYNNYNLAASVPTMYNVYLTVFDGAGAGSHTGIKSVTAQSWIRIYETGFGENSTPPGSYIQYQDIDTPIGKSGLDTYIPLYGSDGSYNNNIRAGVDSYGVGFIEFCTYCELPDIVGFASYTPSISIIYDYI